MSNRKLQVRNHHSPPVAVANLRNEGCVSGIALLLSLWALCGPAAAVLGGTEESVATDQMRMKATRRIGNGPQYTVHEIQLTSGTLVREYVSAQGQVFAVTWRGPLLPDLQQLLGRYFLDYQNAASSKRGGRGAVLVQQPELVLHSGGHMRAFFGRAYVPQLLPTDVVLNDIQ